jgi:IS30 family transposase
MGGDRTCPDDCPLAVWQSLSEPDRKAKRKPIAERLYKQGFTMEAIATQLGVATWTISKDLKEFSPEVKTSRPKGGRPKGSTKPRKIADKHAKIVALADAGVTKPEIAEQTGVGERMVHRVLEVESARREPVIDPATLSMTAQQKIETVSRQYKAKLDADFYRAVENEVRKRIDEIILPHWKQKIGQAQEFFSRRKGLMDKNTFNTIRRALHPDSRHSISDQKLGEAFDAFMALEKFLLDEKQSPTDFSGLPETWADWEKAKKDATAARRARHAKGQSSTLRRL